MCKTKLFSSTNLLTGVDKVVLAIHFDEIITFHSLNCCLIAISVTFLSGKKMTFFYCTRLCKL